MKEFGDFDGNDVEVVTSSGDSALNWHPAFLSPQLHPIHPRKLSVKCHRSDAISSLADQVDQRVGDRKSCLGGRNAYQVFRFEFQLRRLGQAHDGIRDSLARKVVGPLERPGDFADRDQRHEAGRLR